MAVMNRSEMFRRLDQWELTWCLFFNRVSRLASLEKGFTLISRLGDGLFWYSLIAGFALIDRELGFKAALHMLSVGLVCLLVYKVLKRHMVRQRPSITWSQIRRGTAPLDLYSFPSGHTLHAVAFTIVALNYYPGLDWLLLPMTMLVALSRVVLGLHYPSDVLAGALLGAAIAGYSLGIVA